jgi:Zn-dependent protease with chaperone function
VVRYLLFLAISLLAAPLIALFVLRGARTEALRDLQSIEAESPTPVCERGTLAGSPRCELIRHVDALTPVAKSVLIAMIVLPAAYVAAVYALGRRRNTLARYFAVLLRASLVMLAVALIAQGVLLIGSALCIRPPQDSQISGFAVIQGMYFLLAVGAGLVTAGFLAVAQWRRLFEVMPLDVDGVIVTAERMPELTTRVSRLASQLGAKAPTRIIVGLKPRAFVTAAQIKLRGSGVLAQQETLYLPLLAFRSLDDAELDALIGHELGHFRGEDLYFTERFVPAVLGLQRSIESVTAPGHRLLALSRLPAILGITGMLWVLLRVAGPIRQQREFEADRAAIEVSNGAALIAAVTKIAVLGVSWPSFARGYGILAHKGIGRRNLARDYLLIVRQVLTNADRERLAQELLKARVAHPFDSHPTLAQRAAVLKVNAQEVIAGSLASLSDWKDGVRESQSLEEEVTAVETEFARRPGGTITINDQPHPFSGEQPPPGDAPAADGVNRS